MIECHTLMIIIKLVKLFLENDSTPTSSVLSKVDPLIWYRIENLVDCCKGKTVFFYSDPGALLMPGHLISNSLNLFTPGLVLEMDSTHAVINIKRYFAGYRRAESKG